MLESSSCAGVKLGFAAIAGTLLDRSIAAPPAAAAPSNTSASERYLIGIVILHTPGAPAARRGGTRVGVRRVAGDTGTCPSDVRDQERCPCTAAARSCRIPCAPDRQGAGRRWRSALRPLRHRSACGRRIHLPVPN